MGKKVVWSDRAKKDLVEIKEFYDIRNQSPGYSNKLLQSFRRVSIILQKFPLASINTDLENVRGFVVLGYILFYEITGEHILILTIWDCRRDPEQLKRILEK